MSFLPNPIACDVCKAVKQPSNHWWYYQLVRIDKSGFQIFPWAPEAEVKDSGFGHLCGHTCAVKKLSEWMNDQSGEPKPDGEEKVE